MDELQDGLLVAILCRLKTEWPNLVGQYENGSGFKIIIHVAPKREQARIEWPPPISQVQAKDK